MASKRNHQLRMPQLLWGGLSEYWLLKELGDIHWEQITQALNTPSDALMDSQGERLYASFVRLAWSGNNIRQFTENESLDFNSELSQYGAKMFFSQTTCRAKDKKLKAHLMSIFTTRKELR